MYYNNRKLALSVLWVVLGAALLGLSIAQILDSEMYAAMGGALMAVGILQIIRNVRYRRDPAFREKLNTQMTDERANFIRMKSWQWAGTLTVLGGCVAAVAAMLLGQRTVQLTLSYAVCFTLIAYWVSYIIVSKRY